jgi:hypothetical protein
VVRRWDLRPVDRSKSAGKSLRLGRGVTVEPNHFVVATQIRGTVQKDTAAPVRDASPSHGGLGRPPRWLFHSLLVLAALPVLWAFSVPGLAVLWLLAGLMLWAVAGLVWLIRLMAGLASKQGWSWWFVVAPVTVIVLIGLIVASVPLKARWAFSRASFDAAAAALPPAQDFIGGNAQIGSYRITSVERVSTGVIFTEVHGAVFNSAGFAYLPDGPTPDLENGSFEGPQFTPLGGPWYSWTASW